MHGHEAVLGVVGVVPPAIGKQVAIRVVAERLGAAGAPWLSKNGKTVRLTGHIAWAVASLPNSVRAHHR